MNKLGKKLKQGIALLLAALMVVTCVPVDSLVVQAAEVQEDTDGKEQEPAAAVTGEEEDAGDAEDTEDAAAPEGEETAPEDPEETPADPVKGDATVEEGEGTPDAQTTAPQVEEEIVDGTEANVPSQAAAVGSGVELTTELDSGITFEINNLGTDNESKLTATDGKENTYTIADSAEYIKFKLTKEKIVIPAVTCTANENQPMEVEGPDDNGIYTVLFTGSNDSITVNSLKLKVTAQQYDVTVKKVDGDGNAAEDDATVEFSSNNVSSNAYTGEGNIVFSVEPVSGKTIKSVMWGVSESNISNNPTKAEDSYTYTISESALTAAELTTAGIIIVVTLANDGGSVEDSVTVSLDNSITGLAIDPVNGLEGSAPDIKLGKDAQEIQFRLTGDALKTFKAVKVSGEWNDTDTTKIEAVSPDTDGTYTLSVTNKPSTANTLTLKVEPEKYAVSLDEESAKSVKATFTAGTEDAEGGGKLYTGGTDDIKFTLNLADGVENKNIGAVTWNTTDEDAKTLTPVDGTYTISSEDITKAGLTENNDIVISVTLVNIVSVEVKEGTNAEISIEDVEFSGLSKKDDTSPYTINSGVPTISFKLDGNAVTGMKTVDVTGTWKNGNEPIADANQLTAKEDGGVYTITLGEQPEAATKLELSVTTTPYNIVEKKDEGVTITYTGGVEDSTYTGGTDNITFKVESADIQSGKKRVKAVSWRASTAKDATPIDPTGENETYTIDATKLNALTSEDDIVISVELENIVKVTFANEEGKGTFSYTTGTNNGLEGDQAPYTIAKKAEEFTFNLTGVTTTNDTPQINVFASYKDGKIPAVHKSGDIYEIAVKDIPEDVTELEIKYELSKRKVFLNSDSAKEVEIDYPVIEGETNGAKKVEGTTYAEYDGTNGIKFTVAAKEEETRRITEVSWKKNAEDTEKPLALAEDDTTGIYTITQQAINDANLEANDSIIICVKLENIVKVTFELEDFNVIVDKTGSGLKELADGRYDIEADTIKFKVAVDSLKNIKHCEFTAVCAEDTEHPLTVATGSTNEGYTEYTIDVSNLNKQTAKTLTIKTDSASIEYYPVSLDEDIATLVEFTPGNGVGTKTEDEETVTYYYKGGTNDLTFGLTVKPNVPYTIDKVTWKKSADDTDVKDVTFTNGVGTIPAASIGLSGSDEIIISATLKRNPIPVNLVGDDGKVSFAEDGTVTKTEDGTFLYDVNDASKNIVLTAKNADAAMIKRIEYKAGDDFEGEIEDIVAGEENTTYYTFKLSEEVSALDAVSSITITVVWREYVDLTIADNELVEVVGVEQLRNPVTKDETTGKYRVEANEDISLTVKVKTGEKYVISGLTGDCKVETQNENEGNTVFTFQIRTEATVKVVTKVDPDQANSIVFPSGDYSVTVTDGSKTATYYGKADVRTHYTLGTELTLAFTPNPGYVVRSVTKNETESTGGTYTDTDKKVTFTAGAKETLALTVTTKGETTINFDDYNLRESTLQFTAPTGVTKDPEADEDDKTYIVQGSVDEIKFTVNAPAYVTPTARVWEAGSTDDIAGAITVTSPEDTTTAQPYVFTLNTTVLDSEKDYRVFLSENFQTPSDFTFVIDQNVMEIESLTVNGKERVDDGYLSGLNGNTYSETVRKGSTVVVTVKALNNCSLTKTIEGATSSFNPETDKETTLAEGQTSVTLTFSNIGLMTDGKANMAYGKVEGKENLALKDLVAGDADSALIEEGNFSYTVEYGTNKTYLASVRKGLRGIAAPGTDYKFELTGDSVKSTAAQDGSNVKVTVSPEDQGKTLTLTMFTETSTPSTEENGTPTITKNTIGSYTLRVRGKLASLEIEGAKKDAEGVYNFTQLIGSSKDYLLKLSDSDAKAFAKEALIATAYKADGTTISTGVVANVENGILNVTAKSVAETETATIKITNSADGANAAVLATVKVTTASPFTDKTKVTAKALTSDDTTLSLNVTAPKAVPDPADGKLYYEVQLTASGTLTGQGSTVGTAYQYFAKTGASQVLNVNAINPGPGLNNGEKCDFTVAVTLVQASAVLEYAELNAATRSTKVVLTSPTTDPLAMATRDPWYADKLTVKQKVKTVYTGQQNILIGSISYDKNTSYTNAVAGVIASGYKDDDNYVKFDYRFDCTVTSDGSIYMDVDRYEDSSVTIGKRTLRVYLDMPTDTDDKITHFVPYKDLAITVAYGIEDLSITGSSGEIYKKDKKAATVKLTAVDSVVAANKTKVTWSVGKGTDGGFRPLAPSDALYKMVTVNSKGQVTVNKNYVVSSIPSENEFTVRAKAADYAGNTEYAEETLTVTTEPQQLGDIVIYKYGEVIASGATVAELTADQLNGAFVGVLRADVSLDPDSFDPDDDLVDPYDYTIVSSNKKAVDISSYNNRITVSKIANNVKLTATAKDGSGTKKVMTLKKVNYAPLGDLGLKVTVLGQGGKTATLTDQQSFNFSGTTATRIRIDILEKDADGDYDSFGNYNLKKWGISLKGLKEVYSNATKTTKVFVLQKATGSVVLTGDTKTRKWEYKFTNDAFASATIKAPAVKVNSVKILRNGDAGDMDAPLNFTFSGKAQSISAVTDTCKYVLIETDVANEYTKNNPNKTYYFNRTVFGDGKYSKLVPISSGGFTLTPANNWNNYTYAGFTAGSYKLRLTYGDVNDDNEFAAKSKTATVTIKVTADKNTFKLTSTYTMSEQDNAVISLTGSGKTVKNVVINRLRGGVVNGQRNQFLNYLELSGGKIKIKETLPEGKTFADFGALAKQERVGYVQYTVYYNDGTVDSSRVTKDIWEKITINTKKDLVAVKSYKAVVTGDVLAGDTNATAEMTIQANKVPVKVIYMQPDASNEFDVTLEKDGKTFTLKPKNASLTAGKKTVKLTIIPEDSLYGGYGKEDATAIATATANIAKGITVSASVNVKAVTTKGKVSIAANALKQQLRLNAEGTAYEAEIPYTAKVRASIKEVKAFTGAANKLVALEDLTIKADKDRNGNPVLKLSILKDKLVTEKADGKLAWDTTYADSKKVKEAISMTVNFNAAGSVAETFRMTLTTPKNPETFDSIVAAVRECKTNGTLYNVVLSATGYDNGNYLSNVQAGITDVLNGIVLKDSGVTPNVKVNMYGDENDEVQVTITLTQGENTKVFVVVEKNAFEEADNLWRKIRARLNTIQSDSEYSEDLNGDTILSDLRKEFEITSDKTDLRLVKTEETVEAPTVYWLGYWSATFALYNSRTGAIIGQKEIKIYTDSSLPDIDSAENTIKNALNAVYGNNQATNAVTKEEILSVAAKAVAANEALKVDYKKTSDGQDMFVKVDAKTVHNGFVRFTLTVSDGTESRTLDKFEYGILELSKVEDLLDGVTLDEADILDQCSDVLSEDALKSAIEAVANADVISGNADYSFVCTITEFTPPTYNVSGSVKYYLTLKEGQEILGMTDELPLEIPAQPALLKLEDVRTDIEKTWKDMDYDAVKDRTKDDICGLFSTWNSSEYVTLDVATRPDPDKDGEENNIEQFDYTPTSWTAKGKISVILTVSKRDSSESIEVSLEKESTKTLFEELRAEVEKRLEALDSEGLSKTVAESAITNAISAKGLAGKVTSDTTKLEVSEEEGTIKGTIGLTYKDGAADEENTQTFEITIDLKTPEPAPDSSTPSTDSLAA